MEAGWPGLLVSEANGGAGLGAIDAMLVFAELGRVLAGVAAARPRARDVLLDRGGADPGVLAPWPPATQRAAFVPARPPSDVEAAWTVEPAAGSRARGAAGRATTAA